MKRTRGKPMSRVRRPRKNKTTRSNADPGTTLSVPRTMPSAQRMVFQFRNLLSINTDVSGNVNSYIAFDPSATTTATFGSVTQFTEWTNMTALFNRVKLLQFDISLTTSIIDDTKGDIFAPLTIASVRSGSLAVPNSYQTVIDNHDSIQWNPIRDYSGIAKFYTCKIPGLGWGPVGSPGGTTGLGTPGSMIFYGVFGGFTSRIVAYVKVVGTYVLDTRV